ncbi:ParA family protein [Clostridium tagluense]|uniref:ParA family protein n=1 Tax=Clostridium tagluense TaxID=360422 RepID=UPI001C0C2C44|nr:AAA family ATPase [Clostridium tagluense]MBU3130724.1 AAA family ATPase [Clostridium tagluense]
MEIISVVNQKGGVAKTTTTLNLGSCLVQLGKKVLLLDLDSQANLTKSIEVKEEKNKNIHHLLIKEATIDEVICNTNINNLDIICSDMGLSNFEGELAEVIDKELMLKQSLANISEYDYILIDCSPSLNLLTINALVASTSLLIPLEPSVFGLEGLAQLINVLKLVIKKFNSKLKVKGVLLTRVDSRSTIPQMFRNQLKDIFDKKLFETMIHQSVSVVKSQMNREPLSTYDKLSRSYKEYLQLAEEVIKRG